MCEEKHCKHGQEALCSCTPVVFGDVFQMALHLAENMTDVDWCLTYNSLIDVNPYQLCVVGKCRICGGRLCMEQKPFGGITTDDFLAAAYRHLYQLHKSLGQPLSSEEFRTKFVEMFRKENRCAVETWLSRSENRSVHTMYRRSRKKVYTIVHSQANAEKADFPAPEGRGSYLSLKRARSEMANMVELEKEDMQFPFEKELYCEDRDNDFWEATCDGYAAGWFTRYEIIESPLYTEKEGE